MLILTMLTLDIRTCISEYDVDGSDRRQRQTDRQTARLKWIESIQNSIFLRFEIGTAHTMRDGVSLYFIVISRWHSTDGGGFAGCKKG